MSRYPSHMGHVILPIGDGWYVPDYQDLSEGPLTIVTAKRLIEARESHGEPRRDVSEVTWDTSIVYTTGGRRGVNVGEAAAVLGIDKGSPVRVTLKRLDE